MAKCIGIVGSRRRCSVSDYQQLVAAFNSIYKEGDTVVSGGCQTGGDAFAEKLARCKGLTITIHFPKWKALGKKAGFVRNRKIATDCSCLVALVAEDRKGGTEHTIRRAKELGKPVTIIE